LETLNTEDEYYWIIFVLHEVGDNPTTYTAMKKSDFIYLLDTIKDHPEIAVVRTEDIMNAPSSGYNEYYQNLYESFVNRVISTSTTPSTLSSTLSSSSDLSPTTPILETTSSPTNESENQTNTQGENTQGENTQGENTQGENTQGENTQGETTNAAEDSDKKGIWIGVSIGVASLAGVIILLGALRYKYNNKIDSNEAFNIPQELAKTSDDIEKQFGVLHDISMSKEAEQDESDIIVVYDEADIEMYSMNVESQTTQIETPQTTQIETPQTTQIETPQTTQTTQTTIPQIMIKSIITQSDIIIDPKLIEQLETIVELEIIVDVSNDGNSENGNSENGNSENGNSNRIVLEYISGEEDDSF